MQEAYAKRLQTMWWPLLFNCAYMIHMARTDKKKDPHLESL